MDLETKPGPVYRRHFMPNIRQIKLNKVSERLDPLIQSHSKSTWFCLHKSNVCIDDVIFRFYVEYLQTVLLMSASLF